MFQFGYTEKTIDYKENTMQNNYANISEEEYKELLDGSKVEYINENVVSCIFEGIERKYVKVVEDFMVALETKEQKKLKEIIQSVKQFQSNENGCSFKLLCIMFHAFLEKRMCDSIGDLVIRIMPHLNNNNTECNNFFKEYVLETLDISEFVAFSRYGEADQLEKFRTMCSNISQALSYEELSETEKVNLKKLDQWLNVTEQSIETVIEEKKEDKTDKKVNEKATKKEPEEKEDIANTDTVSQNKEEKKTPTKKKKVSEQLSKILPAVKKIEEENENLKQKINSLNEEIDKQKQKITDIVEQNEELNKCLEEKVKELTSAKQDYVTLKNLNLELEAKLKDSENVISIYGKDKSSSQSELLKNISQQLMEEYQDFQESLDMEMCIEIGEVYREKIDTIFKILSKNGIQMEE